MPLYEVEICETRKYRETIEAESPGNALFELADRIRGGVVKARSDDLAPIAWRHAEVQR